MASPKRTRRRACGVPLPVAATAGSSRPSPVAAVTAGEQEHCNALYGVPTMFIAILDHKLFDKFRFDSLRTGIMAGSPCPVEVMKRVVSQMNMREVTIAFGMTETSPVSFQSSTDDPLEKRVSTVGRIHPHVEVKVVDDHGRIVARGQPGELLVYQPDADPP